jgi:hypothetical protein
MSADVGSTMARHGKLHTGIMELHDHAKEFIILDLAP